ncbi:MAG: hypothetical protein WCK77_02005 [Verrucomicrobiota bacterium]
MNELPPIVRDPRKTDIDQLRLLAIFHFVIAGLAIVGLGFLGLHYVIMHTVMTNPEMWKNQKGGGPPPEQFFAIFKWLYVVLGSLMVVGGVGNLLSGLFLRKQVNRVFSLIVAGIDCVQFPFGTALGVFTFIVLLRDSVREIYERRCQ